jgi:tripartite-type tricarboxylate transporter receptor subunit TctC
MKTTEIPFRGAGAAINAVVAAEVDFAVVDASGAIELINSGRLRGLAFTAPERSPAMPSVPTSAEAGVPDFFAYNWVAAAVSAKTPPAVVEKLVTFFQQAGAASEVREFHHRQNTSLLLTSPAELTRYQKEEIDRWKRLAASIPIEPM